MKLAGEIPEEILTLADQWNQMSVVQRALVENLGIRLWEKSARQLLIRKTAMVPGIKLQPYPKCLVYLSIYLYVSLRRQQFENQAKLHMLLNACQVRKHIAPIKIAYVPGVSHRALEEVAPRRFRTAPGKRHRTVSVGDGTRISRIAELLQHKGMQPLIVGEMDHPDITLRKGGFPVSQSGEEISTYVKSVRRRQLLASEVHTEILVCVTASDIPLLVYMIFLECNKGFCGMMVVKLWLQFNVYYDKHDIDCVGVVTDACSAGCWAGDYIMTPNGTFTGLGCGYLGLPSKTFRYMHPFLRPRQASGRVPPPFGHHGEAAHQVRKGRTNANSDSIEWVWQTTNTDAKQLLIVVSLTKLMDLARTKDVHLGFSLKDIVQFNSVIDQKNDAAWHLISRPVIDLLEQHHRNDDPATILFLKAMNWNMVPWKNHMTNPVEIVYRVWRGWAILKMNEVYITKLAKLDKDKYLPSNQFRCTYEKMTCSATIRCLEHFLLGVQQDGLTWDDFFLSKSNADPLEGLHGEGRQYFGNDVNFSGAGWCRIISRLQVQAEMKALLQAYGMEFAVPRHNAKTGEHELNLGCPVDGREYLLKLRAAEDLPATYADFVALLLQTRESAINDGLQDFAEYLPVAKQQLEDEDLWGEFPEYDFLEYEGDDKVRLPTCLADICTPATAVGPNDLVIPEAKLKAMREFEKKVAEQEARDGDEEVTVAHGQDAESDKSEADEEETETDRMDQLRAKAKADFEAINTVDKKVKVFTEHGVDTKQLKAGTHCLDADGRLISVQTLLKSEQRREVISKDRRCRFWVGHLHDWTLAVAEGHNLTYGSVLLVNSTAKGTFCVARVMQMHVDGERKHSCFLPPELTKRRKAKIQLRSEILLPHGEPTEHGSQRYKSSGSYLPLMNASMVIKQVDLMKLDFVNKIKGAFCNDALLLCEDMIQVRNSGLQEMKKDQIPENVDVTEGYKDDSGKWFEDPVLAEKKCAFCVSAWFDSSTGVIVSCVTCGHAYHQQCVTCTIKVEEISTWQCAVCCQDDKDVCRKCGREWTQYDENDHKKNDELVWCEGGCQSWWHQKCHDPPIVPIPKGKFCCSLCSQDLIAEHDDNDAPAPPRRKARKGKPATKKSERIKKQGNGKPGFQNENKNLPKKMPGGKNEGSHLDKMAWCQPSAAPSKKKKKKTTPTKSRSPSPSPSGSSSPSQPRSSSPSSPVAPAHAHEWTTIPGKRVRKQTQQFNICANFAEV